jgi:predicted dehydrogenase
MTGQETVAVDFDEGLAIERTVHAIAAASLEGRWVKV